VERDQQYLMPVSLRDWLPADDLAWFVIDLVGQLDLGPIRARYRADGWGAAAFDPALMTALLLYAYATGERSSRRIEARCRRDIAYRVICANQVPDHATIARFRADHEAALGALFTEVLAVCRAAGLGRLGLVALDGTRIGADASLAKNRPAAALDDEIARILAEHAATDAAEDEAVGPDRHGGELPAELADPRSRLARLTEARRQIEADRARAAAAFSEAAAKRRALPPDERRSIRPPRRPQRRAGLGNPTDPDSRAMKTQAGWIQGYNAQATVAADGLILAAAVNQDATDVGQLGPMLALTSANLAAAGFRRPIGTVVADGGYWSEDGVAALPPGTSRLLIWPRVGRHRGAWTPRQRRWPMPHRDAMIERLERPRARLLYAKRATTVEPVFGHIKEPRGVRRFKRRGLNACNSEWLLTCTTHNVLKLWRHRTGLRSPTDPAPGSGRTPRPTDRLIH
jgi:transposase